MNFYEGLAQERNNYILVTVWICLWIQLSGDKV